MAKENNFKVFNEALNTATTMNDSDYSTNTHRQNGVLPGVADSKMHNKLFRQVSIMTVALANFINSQDLEALDQDVVDLSNNLSKALEKISSIPLKEHREKTTIDHPDKSVTSEKLADNAVTTSKVRNKNITNSKLADNAVDTPNIINHSVTSEKLADNAVTTSKVVNQSITPEKLSAQIRADNDNRYVKKSGDAMTGPLELKFKEGGTPNLKIGGRGGAHVIATGGDSFNDLDIGNKDFTVRSKFVCKKRPEWVNNTRHPIAMLEDLNTKTTDHYRNAPPEVRSLIDWDRMRSENNGIDVRNINVNNNVGSYKAYGGDSEVLARKYRSPGNGPILLNDDYNNYDELLIVACDDSGGNVHFSSITVAHFNIMMNQPYAFGLVGGLLWQIAPLTVANTGVLNASTNTVFINTQNNSAIIDIFGIRYKRYTE